MIFPQPLLLIVCIALPVFFIYFKKRHDLAVTWLAIIIALDIFNSQLYMNLAAVLIFGMTTVPYLWRNRNELSNNPALKILGIYCIYLSLLGAYHGFIKPWPDPTGLRSYKDLAQCRTLLHLGRTFCEGFSILYLMIQLQKNEEGTLSIFLKTIFYCSLLLVFGEYAEKFLKLDFYHFFTGGRELLLADRPRSLDYEPRGLSQNLAYAMLLVPFTPVGKWKYFTLPVFFISAFFFTISFSGIMILGAGLGILSIVSLSLKRDGLAKYWKTGAAAIIGALALSALLLSLLPITSTHYLKERLDYLSKSDIAEKLEIFDSASINFLNHQPKYYFLGTGPGLIYLPAGDYIIDRDKPIWGNHFEALPHMGIVLTLSNSGLVGLLILITAVIVGLRSRMQSNHLNTLLIGCTLTLLYFLQIRYFFILGFACLLFRNKPVPYPVRAK